MNFDYNTSVSLFMKRRLLFILYLFTCLSSLAQTDAAWVHHHEWARNNRKHLLFIKNPKTSFYITHPETTLLINNESRHYHLGYNFYSACNNQNDEQDPAVTFADEVAQILSISIGTFFKPSYIAELDRERSQNMLYNYLKPPFSFRVGVNICFGKKGSGIHSGSTYDCNNYQSQFRDGVNNRPK